MSLPDVPLALDTIVFARRLATPGGVPPTLHDIDLDILPGEIFTIVGRAGSGKSALLEALVGLRRVTADQLMVCGADPRQFPQAVRQRIGVAPRRVALERKMTVDEALRLFGSLYERANIEKVRQRLNLGPVGRSAVDSLPDHLTQRLSLALALLNDPVVFFADEPVCDLDPEGAHLMWDILHERRERGRTSVLTTNHLDDAARISDRVAVIHHGRLIAADSPAALMVRSTAPVRVVVELLQPQLALDALRSLEGVVEAQLDRSLYTLTSRDGTATLRAVMRLMESRGVRPVTLSMRQQTLEDVFLSLTNGQANA